MQKKKLKWKENFGISSESFKNYKLKLILKDYKKVTPKVKM